MATDTTVVKIEIPILEDRSLACPSCKVRKIKVLAGAIEEPSKLPAKCKCGKEFILTFEVE